MKKTIATLAFIGLSSLSAQVMAGPKCTDVPESDWLSKDEMQSRILEQGYKVKKFKVSKGRCYEIYGWDKADRKVEVYFHPVSGEIVKQEIDD